MFKVDSKSYVEFQNFYQNYGKIEAYGLAKGEYEILISPKDTQPTNRTNNTYLLSIDYDDRREDG